MDFNDLMKRVKKKDKTDDEWLQLRDDIHTFLQEDHPKEERACFVPLGYAEVVFMMCDGIERERAKNTENTLEN